MTPTAWELERISTVTLRHYNAHAEDFREGTSDHDVTQNIDALLRHIVVEPPFAILDFGCGPGRDLKAFTSLGHHAVGLDGAERFVAMARDETGCEVWQQDFLQLDLPLAHIGRGAVVCPVQRTDIVRYTAFRPSMTVNSGVERPPSTGTTGSLQVESSANNPMPLAAAAVESADPINWRLPTGRRKHFFVRPLPAKARIEQPGMTRTEIVFTRGGFWFEGGCKR